VDSAPEKVEGEQKSTVSLGQQWQTHPPSRPKKKRVAFNQPQVFRLARAQRMGANACTYRKLCEKRKKTSSYVRGRQHVGSDPIRGDINGVARLSIQQNIAKPLSPAGQKN